MANYLKMPKLSDTMSEGKIAKWNISVGDKVEFGTEIAEIETDKATMVWDVQLDGIVHKIYGPEGGTALLGTPLVLILKPGEAPPADADNPPGPTAAPKAPASGSTVTAPPMSKTSPIAPVTTTNPTHTDSKVKASPLAKKVASERGLDLSKIRGSGPGGRIVRNDLEYSSSGGRSSGSGGMGLAPIFPSRNDQVIPLSGMRRIIADRLLESKTTIPHFYLNIEIDAEPLMKTRTQVNEAMAVSGGPKYTVNDFVMRAVVLAAQEVPAVNASFAGDSIYQYGSVSLAVAVAIEGGLVTPVIKNAGQKSLADLASSLKVLAGKARDKKLTPDEMQGGTITISNLGSYGIHSFDAIINPPQAAILAIGTISKQPVVNDANQIVPGMRMFIGMSCDHRVIDGAVGATYLAALKKYLETPILLVS